MAEDPAAIRRLPPGSTSDGGVEPLRQFPGERWGDLHVIAEIGRGSFGTVYQAHDPRLERDVALKLLHHASGREHLASTLLHEARTLARVRHPNVVTVYGAGEHDGQVGLWMELIRGVTLEHMLVSHGPFSAGEAALIGQELCRALAAVHRAGLVHGDVKAQNVMREEGGRLVLMDFGAGRIFSSPAEPGVVGTPSYLAPELLEGTGATVASDVYSAGVLLYHLVTNDFPIKAASLQDLHAAHLRREVARLRDVRPDLPELFVRVVERATTRDPALRFASAGEMESELARSQGSRWYESSSPVVAVVPERPAAADGTPAALPEPGQTLGRYDIVEQIGAGATGVVYRASDARLKREVAIKVLHQSAASDSRRLALFTEEAQTIAALSHPNIVTVHDIGTERGLWYVVTELLQGQTLRQRLAGGPLPIEEAIEHGMDVAHGLAAAHAKNIVHRDLKPENLMLTGDGWLKILDFGLARVIQPDPSEAEVGTRTRRGEGGGTLPYMSPEQVCGALIDHRSDLFSFGVVLYEMLAGRHPFLHDSSVETVGAILKDDPAPMAASNPLVPAALERIVRRSLRKSPSERFQSAREIAFALEAARDVAERFETSPSAAGERRRDLASVAVLPFTDMSAAKDQESFCDGIAEELINALTQIPDLRVAARTSAFQFKKQARDVRQIGSILNVGAVLEGSVRAQNNRLRITVELVGTADGYQLWSERFDRDLQDVFAVQDEIAAAVVSALKGHLRIAAPRVAHTRDVSAYTSYLEGRYHWNKRTEDELRKSVECFAEAIRRDPGYAEAYAATADAYVLLGTYGAMAPAVVIPGAKQAVDKALELDPALAEAYACRGCLRSVFDWSWRDAEADFLRAVELNPSYPTAHHWYGINHLVPRGRFDEAERALTRALELDPLALAIRTSLGMAAYFAGRFERAVPELLRTLQLDERFAMARIFLGATYIEQRKYGEALSEMEGALRLCGRTPDILANLGYLYGRSGDASGARGVIDELNRLSRERYVSPVRLAQVHVGLGERAEALDALEAAAAERAADLAWVAVRPVFADLRGEPRFARLLDQMNFGGRNASDVTGV